MGCSDTPQGGFVLTPRRVAFAAELALAEGLPGLALPVRRCVLADGICMEGDGCGGAVGRAVPL